VEKGEKLRPGTHLRLANKWIELAILLCLAGAAAGQSSDEPADPAVTMFPHSQSARGWISGQDNIISGGSNSVSASSG
jgi:hypothetical protein